MKKLWGQPLRRQLFIFILLLLVPVLTAAVWSGFATYEEHIGDLNDQTRTTAVTVAETLSREITALDRITGGMDARRLIDGPDPGEAGRIISRLQNERPFVMDIVIRRRSGEDIARAAHADAHLSGSWWLDALGTSATPLISRVPD